MSVIFHRILAHCAGQIAWEIVGTSRSRLDMDRKLSDNGAPSVSIQAARCFSGLQGKRIEISVAIVEVFAFGSLQKIYDRVREWSRDDFP